MSCLTSFFSFRRQEVSRITWTTNLSYSARMRLFSALCSTWASPNTSIKGGT